MNKSKKMSELELQIFENSVEAKASTFATSKVKQNKGVTLIALVITIIVMLVVVAVTIVIMDDSGLTQFAENSVEETENAIAQEHELGAGMVNVDGTWVPINYFLLSEWDKKAAPEDTFVWQSDNPKDEGYGVIVGYKANIDNYATLRFPSRTKKIATVYSEDIYDEDEHEVRSYTKNIKEVEIPNTVIEISKCAFSGNDHGFYFDNLKKISIPGSVINIGDNAFSYCYALETVNLSEGLKTIGDYAFTGCSALQNINIPNTATSIGVAAFRSCENLKQVSIGKIIENPSQIGEQAFSYNEKLTDIIILEGTTLIGAGMFSNSSYANIFGSCSITNIHIPKTVVSIESSAFINCTNLKSVEIPESVINIGEYAFSGCTGLSNVKIPDSVVSLGTCAFGECSNLIHLELSSKLEEIGTRAFEKCTKIESIIIPKSVININAFVFDDWTSEQNIKFETNEPNKAWSEYWNYNYWYNQWVGSGPDGEIKANIIWNYVEE